ncbi:MAG: alkaline shock response membrane anchor protein AmaP [Candidatus Caldatribacterium sp.]|uniref:alkaline shock response membrane anchor protein AmaP n=1 Tax=Candidatus Caldatribacterium sp. TaxID=2282143 RepID=UPI00299C6A65|nr:alkaline shock response membrane anchor protein AmaP [Candidatus Caldatribacterium sp.]MCX7731505.1 alkaline shock response membrane anchor protein AmaP [Candidatus Caldatribacterium sp.]MDW8081851.1 alkaline shock response membrane anchor protein AmaP [Candidatus Calescibacterium sp.]
MQLLGKVIAGIVGVLVLLFALGIAVLFFDLVPLLAIQEWIVDFHTLLHRNVLTRALSAVGIVALVLGAVLLFRLLLPRGGRFIVQRTDEGEIRVSFDSLHALAQEALRGFQEIIAVTPKVERVGSEAQLALHLVVRTDTSIPELSSLVQTKVRERIERQTGITLRNIRLFVDLQPKENTVENP